MELTLRAYQHTDARQIAELFSAAVHAIDETVYSAEQRSAWAPLPVDYALWQQRLQQKQPTVALSDQVIVGFIEFEADGHIDCLYVDPQFQRKGIASQMLSTVLSSAAEKAFAVVYVEASKEARPFFCRFGFQQTAENRLERRGQTLVNYSMELHLRQAHSTRIGDIIKTRKER